MPKGAQNALRKAKIGTPTMGKDHVRNIDRDKLLGPPDDRAYNDGILSGRLSRRLRSN